ncbi:T9SS type A sorting domain-containing protein [Crocinitomicaceae bacterium]|nr:T9SS type A sorting domain-containing protein [Crocinitomicaceae bacterium]
MRSIILGFLLSIIASVNAQTIDFNYTDGTTSSYNLNDIRKITFDVDVMNLHLWDGTIYSWDVNTVGQYEYNEGTVGVLEELNELQLTIFPNPAEDLLNLNFHNTNQGKMIMELYDIAGNMVLRRDFIELGSGLNQQSIDVSEIKSGIYNCRLIFENSSITRKIIKQ